MHTIKIACAIIATIATVPVRAYVPDRQSNSVHPVHLAERNTAAIENFR
jgi:hypothetical protein